MLQVCIFHFCSCFLQGGGFDQLTLDSLYEDALMRRASHISPSSTYGGASNPFTSPNLQDPFIASSGIAPPPNVQLAVMAQQQQMMMLQQQQNFLQQQQIIGTQAESNPFMTPYTVNLPYGTSQDQYQYQHNPFGNPGLL